MSIEVEARVSIDIRCNQCNRPLNCMYSGPSKNIITVCLCSPCLIEANHNSYIGGYDRGHDDGKKQAYLDQAGL